MLFRLHSTEQTALINLDRIYKMQAMQDHLSLLHLFESESI